MPVYEYKCTGCGKVYDVLHMGHEIKEDIVCPSCHATDHKKLMSAPSLSMKESGSNEPACNPGGCCGGGCGLN